MNDIMDEHMIRKIAETARIHLTEEEVAKMSDELEKILEHFIVIGEIKGAQLGESNYQYDMKNTLREDVSSKSDEEVIESIRKEFTKSDQKYLTAPKAIK